MHEEGRHVPAVLGMLLKNNSRGVDVGAHIGSFLDTMIRVAPNARHYAFEASPQKSQWLKRRFPEAEVFDVAVSDKPSEVVFEDDSRQPGYSRVRRANEPQRAGRSYRVRAVRLDDVLLDGPPIDFIKMDIEGGELFALRGARSLIERSRPAILFECVPEHVLAPMGYGHDELYDLLTDQFGYSVFTLADFRFGKPPLSREQFKACGVYPFRAFNFIAVPRRGENTRADAQLAQPVAGAGAS